MREMKDSGVPWIGEIPKEWKLLRNKNAFLCSKEIVGNKSATTQLLSLTTKGIKEKGPDVVGGKVPESFDTYQIVRKGQLVMCLFDLDCSAVFSGLSPFDGMISPAYKVVDCKEGMNTSFASYWFSSVFDGRKFMHYSKNLRYTLTYDEFAVLPIVIPPLCEQQSIAKYLDSKCMEIDAILEKTRASIEEYKKLKQSVITEAVTKGIHGDRQMKDSGVEWIEAIPAEWAVLPLKQLFSFGKGLSITKDNLVEEGHPVISYGQIHSKQNSGVSVNDALIRFVAEKDTSEPSLVYPGDFAFADTSEDLDGCGNCVYNSSSIAFYGGYHTIVLHSKDSGDHKYLAYLFKTDPWRLQIRSRLTEVKLFSVSQKVLKKSTILLPSLAEQKEIAAYLDEKCAAIDSLIASKEALITELEAYKKSIIYEYVTGKKQVL